MNEQTAVSPDAELLALDRLVGIWRISGGAEGTTTFRWMDGGHFLIQEGELVHDGTEITVLEVIGRAKPFGAPRPGGEITSRAYTNTGDTLDYVYEMDGDVLTIWGGEKGSPARCRLTLAEDGKTMTGGWQWPGGGYEVHASRID